VKDRRFKIIQPSQLQNKKCDCCNHFYKKHLAIVRIENKRHHKNVKCKIAGCSCPDFIYTKMPKGGNLQYIIETALAKGLI
jgi:hypothetical protein